METTETPYSPYTPEQLEIWEKELSDKFKQPIKIQVENLCPFFQYTIDSQKDKYSLDLAFDYENGNNDVLTFGLIDFAYKSITTLLNKQKTMYFDKEQWFYSFCLKLENYQTNSERVAFLLHHYSNYPNKQDWLLFIKDKLESQLKSLKYYRENSPIQDLGCMQKSEAWPYNNRVLIDNTLIWLNDRLAELKSPNLPTPVNVTTFMAETPYQPFTPEIIETWNKQLTEYANFFFDNIELPIEIKAEGLSPYFQYTAQPDKEPFAIFIWDGFNEYFRDNKSKQKMYIYFLPDTQRAELGWFEVFLFKLKNAYEKEATLIEDVLAYHFKVYPQPLQKKWLGYMKAKMLNFRETSKNSKIQTYYLAKKRSENFTPEFFKDVLDWLEDRLTEIKAKPTPENTHTDFTKKSAPNPTLPYFELKQGIDKELFVKNLFDKLFQNGYIENDFETFNLLFEPNCIEGTKPVVWRKSKIYLQYFFKWITNKPAPAKPYLCNCRFVFWDKSASRYKNYETMGNKGTDKIIEDEINELLKSLLK